MSRVLTRYAQIQQLPGYAEHLNQPGGVVGINENGEVVGTFAQRRDTAANINALVLADGELAFTTDTKEMFIGDGATAGGNFLYQVPQHQYVARNGPMAAVSAGSETSGDSVFVPKPLNTALTNSLYHLHVDAIFAGDTGNQSNFAVRFNANGSLLALPLATVGKLFRAVWFGGVYSGAYPEQQIDSSMFYGAIGGGTNMLELDFSKWDKSAASLSADLIVSPNLSSTPEVPMAFTLVPRTGASTPASGKLWVTHRRIQ